MHVVTTLSVKQEENSFGEVLVTTISYQSF